MAENKDQSFTLLDPTIWEEQETEAGKRHKLLPDAVKTSPNMLIVDATVAVQTLPWADRTAHFRLLVGWSNSQPGELTIFKETKVILDFQKSRTK